MFFQRSFLGILFLLLICLVAQYSNLFYISSRGFFIDETLMYHAPRYPNDYKTMMTYFGYLLHPLFKFLNYDLVSYRQVWILIYSCVAILFTVCVIKYFDDYIKLKLNLTDKILIFFSIFFSCLYYFSYYTGPTPNYNTVSFVGIMIFFVGLFSLSFRTNQPDEYSLKSLVLLPHILITCMGLFICCLSKITTGIFLGPMGILWLFLHTKSIRLRCQILGYATVIFIALSYCFVIVFSGNLSSFIQDTLLALDISSSHHSLDLLATKLVDDISVLLLWYPDNSIFRILFRNYAVAYGIIYALLFYIVFVNKKKLISYLLIAAFSIDVLRALFIEIFLNTGVFKWINIVAWSVQIWIPWFVFFIAFLLITRTTSGNSLKKNNTYLPSIISIFMIIPIFVYFGSFSRSFTALSGAMSFSVIGFYLYIYTQNISTSLKTFAVTTSTLIIALMLAISSWSHTLVQWHVKYADANEPVSIGISNNQVNVIPELAEYYLKFKNTLYMEGFLSNDPVIAPNRSIITQDAIYVAGGKPLGNPIFYDFAHLKLVDKKEIECSWVILDELIENNISNSFADLDVKFAAVYEYSGAIDSQYAQQNTLHVYKPKELDSCRS